MICVTTVTYVVLVNDQPGQKITPTRGLRQGNLISPYLYLICAEGLNILLHDAESSLKINGIKVARSIPRINHIFFADNNIIFCSASTNDWNEIQNIHDTYEVTS